MCPCRLGGSDLIIPPARIALDRPSLAALTFAPSRRAQAWDPKLEADGSPYRQLTGCRLACLAWHLGGPRGLGACLTGPGTSAITPAPRIPAAKTALRWSE